MAPNADGIVQPILDKNEMEDTLLEYSCTHFANAEGTPFMHKPLSQLLAYDSLTMFGNFLCKG